VFPKLFIGAAAKAFCKFIEKNNYNYNINYISSKEDLVNLIDSFSHYKNYTLPVIISDISFLSPLEQSLLLKFIEDSNLNIILLASRDNILGTVISRMKEFRKYYVVCSGDRAGFIKTNKAREMLINDADEFNDLSVDDKQLIYNKYNPVLSYDDYLVKKYRRNDRDKLLSLIEYSNE
jgi:hypothetical protein